MVNGPATGASAALPCCSHAATSRRRGSVARLGGLEQDYRKMQEIIFAQAPSFDHILEVFAEIESLVNGPVRG
jgi:hypothetical protein